MNIFYLSRSPQEAAEFMCDKHVVKMILETAQLLSTAWHASGDPLPSGRLYKSTHRNHPSAVWARSSDSAYGWLWAHGIFLLHEYQHRYGRIHAATDVMASLSRTPPSLPVVAFNDPPFCGPEQYRGIGDVVACYRAYYAGDKARFARWTRRSPPDWWTVD